MFKSGLVLEGGGMRGVYTAGVLEYFMERQLYFPYIVGVSAGACHAASYLSRQPGRNQAVTIGYIHHPDYISMRNLVLKKELFGMDLIFDQIPNQLVPFDFKTFAAAKEQFWIGTTDCMTGKPVYFDKQTYGKDILSIIRASSSLPFMAKAIQYDGKMLMDGGIADPIPLYKAIKDGVQKNVIILTKTKGYRKRKSIFPNTTRYFYKKYTGLADALDTRWREYNHTLEEIEQMEANGQVFVLRPERDLKVGRAERNVEKLGLLHEQGYRDAQRHYKLMMDWINKTTEE